jgi:uncharacterized protein YfaS (alpha-2-macroglobulin family)
MGIRIIVAMIPRFARRNDRVGYGQITSRSSPMRQSISRAILCLIGCALCLAGARAVPARAAPDPGQRLRVFIDQTLPGLGADAMQLRFNLTRRNTALPAPAQAERAAAEAELRAAEAADDWQRARAAAERRIGLGHAADPAVWLSLAGAALNERNGSAKVALEAAYIGFTDRRGAADEAATTRQALALMRRALGRLGNHLAEIKLLGQMVQAWPDDAATKALLQRKVSRYGFAVRKIDTEPQSFPARACIAFTLPLPGSDLLHPGDYVTTRPAIKALAVTEEQGRLCLSGLPPGAATVVTLHPGLPGIDGTRLDRKLTVRISLPNRQPSLLADPTHYIIPANEPPAIGFASVNISKLKVKIARVAERSLLGFLSSHPLLNPDGDGSELTGDNAPILFTGTAAVPDFVRNRLMHTVLPLAKAMQQPGLYAVSLAPDDGTPNRYGALNVVQLVLRTNLAPTTWRGADGLTVQLRHFTDAAPVAAAKVALIAGDNAVLATVPTDSEGLAHFAAPLLAGPGGEAPAALHITGPDGDFTLVNLNASPFDLTDRGVSGRPQPKPIDPYIWLDRGIYRPGERLHVGVLLRSPDLKPLDVPLHLIVRRPGGQVFTDQVVHWTDDASLVEPIVLSPGAQAGAWTLSLAVSDKAPALASRSFTVAAFVPARLAVDFAGHRPLMPDRIDHQPVTVRFLYGAPGANLTGTASVRIAADPTPFQAFKDYRFGLHDEITNAPLLQPTLPETDANGATSVPIDLTHLPDATHALQAKVSVTINDPSGRAVTRSTTLPIVPKAALIGIKPDFTGGAVDQGARPAFELIAVAPDGKPAAMPVDLSLVRQDAEWEVIWNAAVARWRFTYIDRPVLTRTLTIEPGQPYHLELPALPYGRYRLRLVQHSGGLAASSTIFYSGWVTSSNPAVPARLTVARDKRIYAAGEVAHLHITAPFAGRATLVIANSKVISTRDFDLSKDGPKDETDLAVPVSAEWGAGAYAIVHLYRPANGKTPPERAIGLTWLGLTPGKHKLPVQIAAQPLYRPGRDATFAVRTTPGAYVTLDAVDEGILRLTDFASPDPIAHFFGKRSLGVDIADDYGALLRPAAGNATTLHVGGGGNFGPAQPPIPQKVVSLFAGPLPAGADGVAHFTLHLPDFNGQIRLMAVAWKNRAVGSTASDIISRHKLIADLLLPRFLSPGDRADIGVMLQNLDLPDGRFTVHLAGSGAVGGEATATYDLKPNLPQVMRTDLTARALGTGRVSLDVSGPDGYAQHRERDISVHLVRAPVTLLSASSVPAGGSVTLAPDFASFVSGSAAATLTLGNRLPFDPSAFMQALHGISYRFLEASVSRGLPLTTLFGPAAGPDRAAALAAAVEDVLDDQRYDGAFGLWSSQDDAQPWLTAYATDFLLRARQAGADVPEPPLESALAWLQREVNRHPDAEQAPIYAAYVLALDGRAPAGAIRVMDSDLNKIDHPLARAQLGAALARIGEPDQARRAFAAALHMHDRGGYLWWRGQDWNAGYGTPLRDAWAVPTIIRQSGMLRDQWTTFAADLPGAGLEPDSLNAQELAFAGLAAGTFAGRPETLSLTLDGKAIATRRAVVQPIAAATQVENRGAEAVPAVIAATGIPAAAQPAATHGMELHVAFYTRDGTPLDVSRLDQNTVFVMVVSGRAMDSAPHHAVLTAGLPAGWELAGNISSGAVPDMKWLGTLTAPRARAAADDRYMAAFTLYPPCAHIADCEDNGHDQEFRTAVELRAVTQGRFVLPGATLVDVNHPLERGTTAEQEVTVLPPGTPSGGR